MHVHHPAVPLHFGARERPLFGWLHAPRGTARGGGVVVCNPIGDDAVRAHRVLRHLAERLQRAGFFVLRFDFHGTGDSAGDEDDADRVAAWLDDVGSAVDELRARGRVARVALVGLRLGATLATVAAAARGDVDALVLWSPHADGASFVRHVTRLHAVHRMLEPDSFRLQPPPGWDAGGQEALGFVLTPPTVDALSRLDATSLPRRPAARALVLGGGHDEARVADSLRARGCAVDARGAVDDRFLVTIAHKATLPERELDAIVEWLDGAQPRVHAAVAPALEPRTQPSIGEQPLFFGGATPLFGILSSPPRSAPDRPAIVLFNAGTVHRIGPHRMYVRMARRWAALGFHVLRLDLSGIGDSPAPPGCRENLCYPRDLDADARAAMAALAARTGARRFVLAGLCSGGDIAFQTALADERVAGAVIMNPRTFLINDLALVEGWQRPGYYADTLFDRRKIARLFRGEVDLRRAVAALAAHLGGMVRRRHATDAIVHAQKDVPTSLGRLAARGVDTLLVVAERDPGIAYVDHHFAAGMRALAGADGFRRVDVAGTDHTFTSVYAQRHVADVVTEHLLERHAP